MIGLERLILALVLLLFISGCASVTRGRKDTLVVESVPAGAEVRLSTGGAGRTPTSFQLPRKKALDVYIEKEGYEPLTVHVSSQISGTGAVGMAGNVLIGGIIGVGVDSWTGAAKDLRPNPIKVTMVPLKKEEVSPAGAAPAAAGAAEATGNGAPSGTSLQSPPQSDFKPAGTQVGTLFLPPKPEPARVREMISSVLLGREWEVTEKADDHVVGHIKHRSSEAVLALVFDAKEIRLYCEGWKIDKKTGSHLKPELPDSWIDNIKEDLTGQLGHASVGH
jgi:hypothetical protein